MTYKDRAYHNRWHNERKARIAGVVGEYKTARGCKNCGIKHPAVLQFHHRDPDEKEVNVSEVAWRGWGLKRIMVEVEKCDILCANCHAIEHHNRRRRAKEAADAT